MRCRPARVLIIALAGLWLAGCTSSQNLSGLFQAKSAPGAAASDPAAAGAGGTAYASVPPPLGVPIESEKGLLGSDPNDALSQGKRQYRLGNYGLAEEAFRHAVESHPRDAGAWLGLAASYDELRRFDLADRAYAQAIRIVGPTVAILNNQGYSYMLRGDYKRARATLLKAKRKDPHNKFVANNLRLLAKSARLGKAIE
jgi:Tfp pilus assembly protein PilF